MMFAKQMRKLLNTLPVMIFAKQMSKMLNTLLMMMEAGRREKGYIAKVLTCNWIFNRYTSKTHPQKRFKTSQLKCPKHGLHDEGASIIAKRHKFKIIESTLKQKLTSDLLLLSETESEERSFLSLFWLTERKSENEGTGWLSLAKKKGDKRRISACLTDYNLEIVWIYFSSEK